MEKKQFQLTKLMTRPRWSIGISVNLALSAAFGLFASCDHPADKRPRDGVDSISLGISRGDLLKKIEFVKHLKIIRRKNLSYEVYHIEPDIRYNAVFELNHDGIGEKDKLVRWEIVSTPSEDSN